VSDRGGHGTGRGGARRLFRLGSVRRDVDEELAHHFEATIAELLGRGYGRREAEEEARRRFGNEGEYRRELEGIDRTMATRRRRAEWLASRRDDLRYAGRSLRRSPLFAAAVILTMALGIGANATTFGIVDRLLFRPPDGIRDPGRITRLLVERHIAWANRDVTTGALTFPDVGDFERVTALAAVAAYAAETVTVGRGEGAHQARALLVSGGYFRLLGARPAAGRFLGPDDDRRAAPGAAVVARAYADRRFGGPEAALGRPLDLGTSRYTIVGVAPRGFTGADLEPADMWLPLTPAGLDLSGDLWVENRNFWWLEVLGRLAPGATRQQAAEEATLLHRRGRSELIDAGEYDPRARVLAASLLAARGPLASDESRVARWLAGVSLLVLLIACANVANLMLGRGLRRGRETGIRLALGISRRRLVGQVLLESLLLALLGGAAALLLAWGAGGILRRLLLPGIEWGRAAGGLRLVGFVGAATLLTGLAAGLVPALQSGRRGPLWLIGSRSRTATGSASGLRATLVGIQAGLSLLLLVGAGLFLRSLDRVRSLDLGLDPEDVVVVRPLIETGALDVDQRRELILEIGRRLGALPGVGATSASFATPFYSSIGHAVWRRDRDSVPTHPQGGPYIHVVEPGYFEVLGLRIVRGRGLTDADDHTAPPVVVVNRTMAEYVWPGEEAVGECLRIGGRDEPCATVVGVVEDGRRQSLTESPSIQYYVPVAQGTVTVVPEAILLKLTTGFEGVAAAARRTVVETNPAVRFVQLQPLSDLIEPQARSWKLGASMFSAFGGLALVVAAVGLYSVLAFGVARRRREIGVRAALGARPGRLVRQVVREGLSVSAVGMAVGLVAALAAAPALQPLLFGVRARDPWTLGAVTLLLGLVALAASGVPAIRASRVDPAEVLRAE